MDKTYKIVRFYQGSGSEVIDTGLTLTEAQKHCRDTETSSSTCSEKTSKSITLDGKPYRGMWFDGYTEE